MKRSIKAVLTGATTVILYALLAAQGSAAEGGNSYVVPASESLAEPMELPLRDVKLVEKSDGRIRLDYSLPAELDGRGAQSFDLEGLPDGDFVALTGRNAQADCTIAENGAAACTVHYADLTLNNDGAEDFLASQGIQGEHLAGLRAARASLERQAIGVVVTKLKKRGNHR